MSCKKGMWNLSGDPKPALDGWFLPKLEAITNFLKDMSLHSPIPSSFCCASQFSPEYLMASLSLSGSQSGKTVQISHKIYIAQITISMI
jgi:hypothetical protein